MKKVTFKVGDKVYCPEYFGTKIYILESCGMDIFPLQIDGCVAFNEIGKANICLGGLSAIFHATAENHALLEKLYGTEFEAPPKKKTPKEVIQIMLISGWDSVPCIDVRYSNHKFFANKLDIQRQLLDFSIPFDPKTGKAIIDYVDGEIITE